MKPTKIKKSLSEGYRLEKDLKKDVKKLLDDEGVRWFMPVPTGFSENAVDFLCCARGTFLAIETKVGNNKPTKLQLDFLVSIIKAGGSAVVAYDLEEIRIALHEIDQGRQFYSEQLEPWLDD